MLEIAGGILLALLILVLLPWIIVGIVWLYIIVGWCLIVAIALGAIAWLAWTIPWGWPDPWPTLKIIAACALVTIPGWAPRLVWWGVVIDLWFLLTGTIALGAFAGLAWLVWPTPLDWSNPWLAIAVIAVCCLVPIPISVYRLTGRGCRLSGRRQRTTPLSGPPPKLNPDIEKPDPVLQARFEANRRAGKEA